MVGPNKLLAELGGKTLVRLVRAGPASKAQSVIVVTGHQASRSRRHCRPESKFRFAIPISPKTSQLSQGRRRRRARKPDGAVICLGDMPLIDAH